MSFGAIFTALYFLFVAGVLSFAQTAVVSAELQTSRWSAIALLIFLALGLLANRLWARWTGLLLTIAIATGVILSGAEGSVMLAVLLGSLVGGLLLLLKAGGSTSQRSGPGPVATGLMLATGVSASVMVVGLVFAAQSAGVPGKSASSPANAMRVSQTRVGWMDFGSALQIATAEDLPILVTFETPWCGYCKKMNRITWRDSQVIDRLSEIITVRINAEDTEERSGHRGVDLARRYKVRGYPTLLLIRANGQVISRTSGFLPPRQLLAWLEGQLGRRSPVPSVSTISVSGS